MHMPPGPPGLYGPSAPFDAPLTYQWTDGIPGQTPAPAIIPGYEDYVATCCSRRLPGLEPPALATNLPPQPYRDRPFTHTLDPAAAPWVPPEPESLVEPVESLVPT